MNSCAGNISLGGAKVSSSSGRKTSGTVVVARVVSMMIRKVAEFFVRKLRSTKAGNGGLGGLVRKERR